MGSDFGVARVDGDIGAIACLSGSAASQFGNPVDRANVAFPVASQRPSLAHPARIYLDLERTRKCVRIECRWRVFSFWR